MKQHISPKELGQAIGVSESSLKRWTDEGLLQAFRTAGGHRRIAIDEAVRFIRHTGMAVIDPDAIGMPEVASERDPAGDGIAPHQALASALTDGNGPRVRGLLLGAYLAGQPVAAIFDRLVTPALHAIGELWRHDVNGIFIEHRATATCMEAIHQLRALFPPTAPTAPVAVGGALSSDIYMVPSLMAGVTLAGDGWREMNLGPDTPVDSLLLAATATGARLVWVSVSVEMPEQAVAEQLIEIATKLHAQQTRLIVGGRRLPTSRLGRHPNLHTALSMSELAAFAAGLRAADPA